MEDKKILLDNIEKIHTTEMGADRIRRNLGLDKTAPAADPDYHSAIWIPVKKKL